MPKVPWHWNATEVDAILDKKADGAEEAVADVNVRRLNRFFSHLGFDGLKMGTLGALYDAGLTTPRKILRATTQQLMQVEGVKDQKALQLKKFITAGAAETYSWAAVGSASGFFGVGLGETKLDIIEDQFPNWDKAFAGKSAGTIKAMVAGLEGFQTVSAVKFAAGIPKLLRFVAATPELKVATPKKVRKKAGPMTGVAVLFTGFRNKDISARIAALGGTEVNSIGQATILVAKDPEGTSSKIKAAKDKGVPIMGAEAFVRKYKL